MSKLIATSLLLGRSCRYFIVFTMLVTVAAVACAATIHFNTHAGDLQIEVEDANVRVALDGQELKITGAGPDEIRLGLDQRPLDDDTPGDMLTITKDDRVVVRVRMNAEQRARKAARPREELIQDVRTMAGELVQLRNKLDDQVWQEVKPRWTTTEAAKLLIGFFRGDGILSDFRGTPAEAEDLRSQLIKLRLSRKMAFSLMSEIAEIDAERPTSPLCGSWKIVEVRGAGGIAADALELYEPDPIGRKFVAANHHAALLTGAGFWLFDASYDEQSGVDLNVVVRGNTIYRGRFQVDGDDATLRINPMNAPRPFAPDGEPTDGGFVLRMRRMDRR